MHFTELWTLYIIAGYGSEDNIPQETLYIQLQPFINASWWSQLLEMGIKEKTFKQIPEAIKAVAGRYITVFDKRFDFLKTRRGNMAHRDFLLLLENKIDQTNFKECSRDQMVATLFLTFADIEMSKVVTELMNKDSGLNMVELRAQIRSLESSTWYKGAKKESANLGPQEGLRPPQEESGVQGARGQPTILWIVTASVSGAKAENCRFKKDVEAKEEQLKANKAAKKKKSKNKSFFNHC